MGTMLYEQGRLPQRLLRRTQPAAARRSCATSTGSTSAPAPSCIETNTFGANPVKLAQHGLAADTEAINAAAARAGARGRRRPGRGGRRDRPARHPDRAVRRDFRRGGAQAFARQVRGLLAGGVDGFICETFSDVDGTARRGARRCESVSDLPVIAQMTVGDDGRTHYGTDPVGVRPRARRDGRRRDRRELLGRPARRAGGRRAAGPRRQPAARRQPNAGLPRDVGDRKMYMASPGVHGELRAADGRGRCPVRRRVLRHHAGAHQGDASASCRACAPRHAHMPIAARGAAPGVEPVPLAERSRLGAKLARGEFVTTVEIVPPKGVDPAPMFEQVACAQGGRRGRGQRARRSASAEPDGRAAVGAADRARGGARGGGPLRLPRPQPARHAVRPARRRGSGTSQPADRHRRPAEDGALPGRHRGLRHRLHRTDQPGLAAQPRARSRRQSHRRADAVRASAWASIPRRPISSASSSASRGRWRPGRSSPSPSRCSTSTSWTAFSTRVEASDLPIVAGIWPLVSLRNAEFLANEVPGVSVPPTVFERMRRASAMGKEEALAEGVRIAREMLAAVRGRVTGRAGRRAARPGAGGAGGARRRD